MKKYFVKDRKTDAKIPVSAKTLKIQAEKLRIETKKRGAEMAEITVRFIPLPVEEVEEKKKSGRKPADK